MLSFFPAAFAAGTDVYLKSEDHLRVSLSRKDYDDIRIVGNKMHWIIKKRNLNLTVVYADDKIESLFIQRFYKNKKATLEYTYNGHVLTLVKANLSPVKTYNYTVFDSPNEMQMCTPISKSDELISTLNNKLDDTTLSTNLEACVDKNCDAAMDGAEDQWKEKITPVLKLDPKTKQTALSKCLSENPDIQKIFGDSSDGKDQIKVLTAKLNLESAKVYAGSEQEKPLFTCPAVDPTAAPATYTENGPIVIHDKTVDNDLQFIREAPKVVSHELLHKAGVTDEKKVDQILDICIDKQTDKTTSTTQKNSLVKPLDGSQGTSDPISSAGSSVELVASASANITQSNTTVPAQIAPTQVQLPTAQQLASTADINTTTDAGVSQAITQSQQQSSGLVSFANQVTAPILGAPAEAAPAPTTTSSTTLASSEMSYSSPSYSSSSSVSRAPSSVASTSSSSYSASSSGLNSGEHIAQDITVGSRSSTTASATSASTSAPASAPIDLAATAASINTRAASIAASVPGATNQGGSDFSRVASAARPSAGTNATASATNIGSSSDTPAPVIARAVQRQPSSVSAPTIVTTPAKDELMTYLLKSDYQSAHQKLQDPKMQQNLKTNDITVTDLSGNSYGASRGKTIILDQGDRFVQQK